MNVGDKTPKEQPIIFRGPSIQIRFADQENAGIKETVRDTLTAAYKDRIKSVIEMSRERQ